MNNRFLEAKGYKTLTFQMDAVEQACHILNHHSGVILADVVGLGKSIIACLIAKRLKQRGIVIAPPGLIGDRELKTSGWAKYFNDFELYDWELFSSGKLDVALERVKNGNFDVVIMDEAHRFRNEYTDSYTYLHSICRDKKVILLTATPFNNNPSDVFSYLKLFSIPKKSTLIPHGDLEKEFRELEEKYNKLTLILKQKDNSLKEYKAIFPEDKEIDERKVKLELKNISNRIKSVLENVLIRRNRLDLKKNPYYKNEIKELPTVHPPIECFFSLNDQLNVFYDNLLQDYFSEDGKFTGAVYRPDRYRKKNKSIELIQNDNPDNESEKAPPRNLYDFMRRLLVKRFESSLYAFSTSLENFINFYQKCLDFINKTNKFVYNRKVIEEILIIDIDMQDDEELNAKLEELLKEEDAGKNDIYPIEDMESDFVIDIRSDIALLEKVKYELNQLGIIGKNDPKIAELKEKLNEILSKKQKVIVFTEFIDTAKYLSENLQDYRVLTVTRKPTKDLYHDILANFDASYPKEKWKDKFDILLVTDRFSEGYNLNRANHVFNFDIPWNPVRAIQRLGRINRIGTMPYTDLYIYNFFPTVKGEEHINLRKTAETKMFMIHQCLGEDAKIFSEDEEPTASELYKRLNTNPEEFDEQESLLTKVINILNEHKDVQKRVGDLPRYIKVAKKYTEENLVLAVQRSNSLYFFLSDKEYPVSLEEVIEYIKCEPSGQKCELSSKFWDNYQKLKTTYQNYSSERKNKISIGKTRKQKQSHKDKAINIIQEVFTKNPHWLDDNLKRFLENLLIDLIDYSTLPINIVKKIASIKLSEASSDGKKSLAVLNEIRNYIDPDYFDSIREKSKNIKNEIIICIENQKDER